MRLFSAASWGKNTRQGGNLVAAPYRDPFHPTTVYKWALISVDRGQKKFGACLEQDWGWWRQCHLHNARQSRRLPLFQSILGNCSERTQQQLPLSWGDKILATTHHRHQALSRGPAALHGAQVDVLLQKRDAALMEQRKPLCLPHDRQHLLPRLLHDMSRRRCWCRYPNYPPCHQQPPGNASSSLRRSPTAKWCQRQGSKRCNVSTFLLHILTHTCTLGWKWDQTNPLTLNP